MASVPEIIPARDAVIGGALFTTASVPADQRLAFWRDIVCQTIAGVEAKPMSHKRSYAGRIRSRPISLEDRRGFDLLHVAADPQRVNRTRELIDLQAEEAWLVMIQDYGTCGLRQSGQCVMLEVGDIGFLDTSRPYEVLFAQNFRQSILKVPKSLFDDMIALRRDVAGTALPGSDPLTAIARHNLLLLERFAQTIDPVLLPAAAERAIDHLGLAMRARFDSSPVRRDGDTSVQHFARAAYIADHLRDPLLSVGRVAKAVGLSAGHLHEIFRRATGATVGDYIRDQRLARCRRDLADRSLAHRSITSIAYRWGFSEASSFSRAFRAAFEMSPRDYRRSQRWDGGAISDGAR
jgi:AraC-like DNA-binding protein